ncbi:hypothetical protein P280DRAFT_327430 [Massarina eburnea CBS 473.64]|uniref:Uncharacterized protein n=1 Tax=Massarina eburnea CBS 473.64 TaxID=1395130 RepID=A0A6A6S143_9PLEO|nr:hypothetical protein P280DRAFT_327430 [Massarina eburnea CBS 473.64]
MRNSRWTNVELPHFSAPTRRSQCTGSKHDSCAVGRLRANSRSRRVLRLAPANAWPVCVCAVTQHACSEAVEAIRSMYHDHVEAETGLRQGGVCALWMIGSAGNAGRATLKHHVFIDSRGARPQRVSTSPFQQAVSIVLAITVQPSRARPRPTHYCHPRPKQRRHSKHR